MLPTPCNRSSAAGPVALAQSYQPSAAGPVALAQCCRPIPVESRSPSRSIPVMKTALSTLIVLTTLLGCVKTIPVDPGPYNGKIAIEGLLQPGESPTIYLNTTVPFFEPRSSPSELFARGATATISGPDGVDELVADSVYNRFWCRWEPFYRGGILIREDQEYVLNVHWNGGTWTASTRTNVEAVSISGTDYVATFTDIYGGHEGVIVDFDDLTDQVNQYRFMMDRPLNMVHETVDDFEWSSPCLTEGETYTVREFGRFIYYDTDLDGAPVRFVVEPAYTHFKDDTGSVSIQSLNREVADYFDVLDRQREANINPFIEPVFLKSQIEGAIGVFGAVNRSPAVPFVFPLDAG